MRTVSRNRSGVPNACCTPGDTRAKAPCASSRRNASICLWITPRISLMSAALTPLATTGKLGSRTAKEKISALNKLAALPGPRDRDQAAGADHLLQPLALGHHPLRVVRIGIARGAVVLLQPGDQGPAAIDVLLQDARADQDVALRVEHRMLAAGGAKLVQVEARNDLHQAFSAHSALGDRVEARFDRDDR